MRYINIEKVESGMVLAKEVLMMMEGFCLQRILYLLKNIL